MKTARRSFPSVHRNRPRAPRRGTRGGRGRPFTGGLRRGDHAAPFVLRSLDRGLRRAPAPQRRAGLAPGGAAADPRRGQEQRLRAGSGQRRPRCWSRRRPIHGFAVVKLAEAVALREAGIQKPILLMGPFDEAGLEEAVARDIMPMVYTPDRRRPGPRRRSGEGGPCRSTSASTPASVGSGSRTGRRPPSSATSPRDPRCGSRA